MSKQRRKVSAKKSSQGVISPGLIMAVVAGAVLLVAGLVWLGTWSARQVSVDESSFPSLGNANAPVTITEFSDFG